MINNPIIFYIATILITIFALLALFARNVIYSLLASVVVFFFGALFFYLLGSEYNAIIQAAIYGFAVPILIGLSIMFSTNSNIEKDAKKHFKISYLSVMCGIIFILASIYLIMMSLAINPETFNIMETVQINSFDTIRGFAKGLFINYVWGFELVSLLLTIVIVGLSILRKRGL